MQRKHDNILLLIIHDFPTPPDVGSVEGLTYDHLVQELYWTSYTLFSIFKISLERPLNSSNASARKGLRIVQLMAGDHPRSIIHEPCFSWVLLRPSWWMY